MKLDGWTKVGDNVSPTGKWTVYRFKGKEFDDVLVLEAFPPEDAEKATKLYTATIDGMKRGACWLVAPDGKVVSMTFLRPGETR